MIWTEHKARLRRFLRDPDSNLWDDELLLRFYNDEQHAVQNRMLPAQDIKVIRLPPVFVCSYLYDHEWPFNGNANGETYQIGYYSDPNDYVCTYHWEIQYLENLTPTTNESGHHWIHPWEWWYASDPMIPPPIPLPSEFHRMRFIAWDRDPINGNALKQIQDQDPSWNSRNSFAQQYFRHGSLPNVLYLYPVPNINDWQDYIPYDLLENGAFDYDCKGPLGTVWTLGTGWSISSGKLSCDGSQADWTESYTIPILPFVANQRYRITYTVSNYSAGNVKVYIGGGVAGTSEVGETRTADGTYTDTLRMTEEYAAVYPQLRFSANVDFIGSIDDVTVYKLVTNEVELAPDEEELFYSEKYYDVDNNLLVVFDKVLDEITNERQSSELPSYLHKYLESGVLERAYSANTDGKIESLRDYWAWRKAIGYGMIQSWKNRQTVDRDYQLTTKGMPSMRTYRHPRLPDEYPPV